MVFNILLILSFITVTISTLIGSVTTHSAFCSVTTITNTTVLLFRATLGVFNVASILPLANMALPFIDRNNSSVVYY